MQVYLKYRRILSISQCLIFSLFALVSNNQAVEARSVVRALSWPLVLDADSQSRWITETRSTTNQPHRVLRNSLQFAEAKEANMHKAQGDSEKRPNCSELLSNPPLTDLHKLVSEGYGSKIDDQRLGAVLLGVSCEESEITRYMEDQGFQFLSQRSWPETQSSFGHGGYQYNKEISFCARPQRLVDRLLLGRCATIARFKLSNSTITRILGGGTK